MVCADGARSTPRIPNQRLELNFIAYSNWVNISDTEFEEESTLTANRSTIQAV